MPDAWGLSCWLRGFGGLGACRGYGFALTLVVVWAGVGVYFGVVSVLALVLAVAVVMVVGPVAQSMLEEPTHAHPLRTHRAHILRGCRLRNACLPTASLMHICLALHVPSTEMLSQRLRLGPTLSWTLPSTHTRAHHAHMGSRVDPVPPLACHQVAVIQGKETEWFPLWGGGGGGGGLPIEPPKCQPPLERWSEVRLCARAEMGADKERNSPQVPRAFTQLQPTLSGRVRLKAKQSGTPRQSSRGTRGFANRETSCHPGPRPTQIKPTCCHAKGFSWITSPE